VEGHPLDDTESDLVARAQGGDLAAFEEIVRRYQELAFRVAYTIVGSVDDAEDAAQEGFVRAYRALGRFHRGEPLRPWLVTIVANAARTRGAVAARHPTLTLDAASAFALDDAAQSPEVEALAQEQRRELLRAVSSLRLDDQHVIACRYFLDLSEGETAALLGCARGTVKSRLSRALGRLRLHLQPTGGARTASRGESHD
jgi:RNA polymerase sigma factor (sigma-70 family)